MSDTSGLVKALLEAQKEAGHARAAAINPAFKSKYVPLEDLIDYVNPIFNKHGVWIQQKSHIEDGGICIETVFQGHGSSISSGMVFVVADKKSPQGYGSAMTYARRYSLSLATGVGGDKDDDGNKAQHSWSLQSANASRAVPKPEQSANGRYKIKLGDTLIVSADTSEGFLEMCRQHLSKPEEKSCQDMFRDSLESIKAAHEAAIIDSSVSKAYATLRGLFIVQEGRINPDTKAKKG